MPETSVPALSAPPLKRDNPLTRSATGVAAMILLTLMVVVCLASLPFAFFRPVLETSEDGRAVLGERRYNEGDPSSGRQHPSWWPLDSARDRDEIVQLNTQVPAETRSEIAARHSIPEAEIAEQVDGAAAKELREHWNRRTLGTDMLGRSLLVRLLAGGGISLTIGIAAALLSVTIGTLYGTISAMAGGVTDAIMMRVVDILFGLPYILLVVLLAVSGDALKGEYISQEKAQLGYVMREARAYARDNGIADTGREAMSKLLEENVELRDRLRKKASEKYPSRNVSETTATLLDILILLIAIGGVSWLTMSRVIRGQVLSLKGQPFMEAARALGVPRHRQFFFHLLPNLVGPIVVYTTLTVPLAILQESFLSFLGIGVKPPLPSWGNLAADGLQQLNTTRSHWWLLFFPCLLLGVTLLSLNFVGEGLREAFDPKRARR